MAQILHPSALELPSRSHTPPYVSMRHTKRPLTRTHSPASRASSIHPFETASPEKKQTPRRSPDSIRIRILEDREAAQFPDGISVHPDTSDSESSDDDDNGAVSDHDDIIDMDPSEAESQRDKVKSHDSDGDGMESQDPESSDGDSSDSETSSVIDQLSNLLGTEEQGRKGRKYAKQQAKRRNEKRASLTLSKRSHSKSAVSESGAIDQDAMDDHCYPQTKRRMRRRTRGPGDDDFQNEALEQSLRELQNTRDEEDGKSAVLYVEHIGRL